MAGGRKIDDHSCWAGGPGKDAVCPDGVKVKGESSAEGAGMLMQYEDTTERIKATQDEDIRQAKGRPLKPGYRN